jgi:hypothetical protein
MFQHITIFIIIIIILFNIIPPTSSSYVCNQCTSQTPPFSHDATRHCSNIDIFPAMLFCFPVSACPSTTDCYGLTPRGFPSALRLTHGVRVRQSYHLSGVNLLLSSWGWEFCFQKCWYISTKTHSVAQYNGIFLIWFTLTANLSRIDEEKLSGCGRNKDRHFGGQIIQVEHLMWIERDEWPKRIYSFSPQEKWRR